MEAGFVGRQWERGELGRRIAAAQAGSGALVLIGGDAGVGKTRLVEWALGEAGGGKESPLGEAGLMLTAVSRCAGPGETPLYGPWRDLAAQLDALPWPAPLLATGLQPQDVATAVAQALRTAGRPLALVIEDLQWADAASLDLLQRLAVQIGRLPVLLLVTYRTTETDGRALTALQRAGALRLPLQRFTPEEVAELTALLLPNDPGSGPVARYLHLRTGGHPLFVSELLSAARAGAAPEGPLPETVQQVIDQQLDRLEAGAISILQAAAVIGERFAYDLLVRVVEAPEDEVLGALEAGLALRLLRSDGPTGDRFAFDHALVREVLLGRLIGPRRRRWHLRVAEALLASVDAGLAVAGGGRPGPLSHDPETLALHLERAGDSRAVTYLLLAGDRALRLGARSEARERYEKGLALLRGPGQQTGPQLAETLLKLAFTLEDRPTCAEALRTAEASRDAAVTAWARHLRATWHAEDGHPGALAELEAVRETQESLRADERYQSLEAALYGEALSYPRVSTALALALTKAGRANEAETLVAQMQARTRPGEPRTPILRVQWWMASLMGRWDDALEMGRRLTEALQAEGDDRAAFNVASNRLYHSLLCKADQPAVVDGVAAEMRRLGERLATVSGYDPLATGHPPLGWYSYLRGDWEAARRHLLGYLESHPSDADPGVRGFAAMLQLALGETAGARATLLAVPPLHPDEEPGLHTVQISAYTMRADLCLAEGDLEGARRWLDGAVRYQQQRGGMAFRASVRLTWARFHLATGDLEAALAEAEQALAQAGAPREFRALIAAQRALGEVAARLGRQAEAQAHLREAQALAERCQYPYEVAMAQLVQAEVLPGTPVDLEGARATFARLGAAPALARAEAVRTTSMVKGPAAASGGSVRLSDRELEVVRLVAEGLTDKEIAGRLILSPRTVDGHLRRIFAKLNVPSRAGLAAYAARRGWI